MSSLQRMRPFVPLYFKSDLKSIPCNITLENLLYGKENGSFIDIKLGQSTVTQDCIKRGTIVTKVRELNDYMRTTGEHGFTVAGICLKDPTTGQVVEKHYKLHTNIEESKKYIADLFK